MVRAAHIALALALVFALLGCSARDPIDALEVDVTADYPAVVKIVLPLGLGMCTGTFIGQRAILTAAHCTQKAGTYYIISSFGKFQTSTVENLGNGSLDDRSDLSLLILTKEVADPTLQQVFPLGEPIESGDEVRLVGYGCNNVDSRRGAGTKRTGTNRVRGVGDYIELETPRVETVSQTHNLVGPRNRAGTCFGDSGGPLLSYQRDGWTIVGVSHAGGWDSETIYSEFVDLHRVENRDFFQRLDRDYSLNLFDDCLRMGSGRTCPAQQAFPNIFAFLEGVWEWVKIWFALW